MKTNVFFISTWSNPREIYFSFFFSITFFWINIWCFYIKLSEGLFRHFVNCCAERKLLAAKIRLLCMSLYILYASSTRIELLSNWCGALIYGRNNRWQLLQHLVDDLNYVPPDARVVYISNALYLFFACPPILFLYHQPWPVEQIH